MAEKQENVVMLKGLRLNMFNDGLYEPEVELTTKGKHEGKYRFNWFSKFILPPKDTTEGKALVTQIRQAMSAAKKVRWGDKADDIRIKSTSTPLGDGDHEDVTFSAYEGCYFLSASKTVYGRKGGDESDVPNRPFRIIGPKKVKDKNGDLRFPDMEVGQEGAPYSGCYVNLKVEFWGQDADGTRGIPNRINATILAVQFARHGDPFGGGTRTNVDEEFDEEDFDDDFGDEDDLGGSSSSDDDDDFL